MISKFLFGTCGIAQLFVKRKNLKTKKIINAKNNKNGQESKETQKKIKVKAMKDKKDK